MRVEICNDGWLVVGERKVDDRPGQVEWIVEREATGGPSAVSIPVRLHLSMRAVCGFPPDSTMTAESTTAYAWIWLPQETEPVPVGRLDRDGVVLLFTYGRSYLERDRPVSARVAVAAWASDATGGRRCRLHTGRCAERMGATRD